MNNQSQTINQSKNSPDRIKKLNQTVFTQPPLSQNPQLKQVSLNQGIIGNGLKGTETKNKIDKPLYQAPYLIHETMNAYSTQFFLDNGAPSLTQVNPQDEEVLGFTSNIPSFGFSVPVSGKDRRKNKYTFFI